MASTLTIGYGRPPTDVRISTLPLVVLSLSPSCDCGGGEDSPRSSIEAIRLDDKSGPPRGKAASRRRPKPGSAAGLLVPAGSIAEQLALVSQRAAVTYDRLNSFVDTLFSDGLRQGKTVVCSVARTRLLSGQVVADKSGALDGLATKSAAATGGQKFVRFDARWHRERYRQVTARLRIKAILSKAYGIKESEVWPSSEVPHVAQCEAEHKAVIPNDSGARQIERRALAGDIVRAGRRLALYAAKLPVLEQKMSRALALKGTIKNMTGDLAVDLLDPTRASADIAAHAKFLNEASSVLDQVRREVSMASEVEDSDIQRVLKIIDKPAPATPDLRGAF